MFVPIDQCTTITPLEDVQKFANQISTKPLRLNHTFIPGLDGALSTTLSDNYKGTIEDNLVLSKQSRVTVGDVIYSPEGYIIVGATTLRGHWFLSMANHTLPRARVTVITNTNNAYQSGVNNHVKLYKHIKKNAHIIVRQH